MRVFFTYSDDQKDVELFNGISKHMKILVLKKLFHYTDKKSAFIIGMNINDPIKIVENNDIIIALISAEFINDENNRKIFKEASQKNKIVLPILGQNCLFNHVEELDPYIDNLLPKNQSIMELFQSNQNQSAIYTDIVEKIQDFLVGDINVDLYSGRHFLWISILSTIMGGVSAYNTYISTKSIELTVSVLILFIIISLLSLHKFYILK